MRACLVALSCVAASSLFAASSVRAADGPTKEEGFVELFNGKDLTGWRNAENGKFRVEDGKLVVSGPRAHLFTEKEDYKNFVVKAEIMTTPGSNSGFYFHTKYQESGWPSVGHEAQVNQTHKDPVKSGSLYGVVKNFEAPAKDGEWYTMTVTVQGKKIKIEVNGKTIVDYEEPADVKGDRKLSQGAFAIQAHDPQSTVYYRSVRVKRLPE